MMERFEAVFFEQEHDERTEFWSVVEWTYANEGHKHGRSVERFYGMGAEFDAVALAKRLNLEHASELQSF